VKICSEVVVNDGRFGVRCHWDNEVDLSPKKVVVKADVKVLPEHLFVRTIDSTQPVALKDL
jgi:hypothetical protein